jgi:hypothetical protein
VLAGTPFKFRNVIQQVMYATIITHSSAETHSQRLSDFLIVSIRNIQKEEYTGSNSVRITQ